MPTADIVDDEGSVSSLPVMGVHRTCAEFIGDVCAREMPDNPSVQLCVLSVGFDVEGVVAQLLLRRIAAQHGHRRVYCVVVPDRLPPGAMTRFASAIERHLALHHAKAAGTGVAPTTSPPASRLPVVAIEEGTGTRERCVAFQRGAVVVLTSNSLCADLLHRRLAAELVAMAVLALPQSLLGGGRLHDALAPQTAFCAELLLRGGGAPASGQTPPPSIVLASDAPVLMQSLVQRHHMGAERFVQQLHVGDVQLFPRFRLDFVRHFEDLSRRGRRPLAVDRVVAPVAPSVLALDGLLAKIVLETLQELQRLEQQQHRHAQRSSGEAGDVAKGWSPAAQRAAAAAAADEDAGALRFLPRARLSASATAGGPLDAGGHRASGEAASYIRRPWRATSEVDGKGVLFSGISEAAALSADFSDLDGDLRAVVRRHETQWPYRLLTESLIDVRRLRRATRGTAFSFLLQLESVLERRLPRRSVYGTGATPPAALWTLSSHFHDVVTVATHRIGTVVYRPACPGPASAKAGTAPAGPQACGDGVVVVDSGSDGSDGDVGTEGDAPRAPRAGGAALVPRLTPNAEEQETDVEVMVRLVSSWCRTLLRRGARETLSSPSPAAADTTLDATPDASSGGAVAHPTLLLLAIGGSAVVRYAERLTHTLEAYQQLQLRRFMRMYQAKYGVELAESTANPDAATDMANRAGGGGEAGHGGEEVQLPQSLLLASTEAAEDASSEEDGDGTEDEGDGRPSTGPRAAATPRDATAALYGGGAGLGSQGAVADIGAGAFHQALLSQLAPATAAPAEGPGRQPASATAAAAAPPSSVAAPLLMLERVMEGVITLCPDQRAAGSVPQGAAGGRRVPRVLVLDATAMSATELTTLLDGSHAALRFDQPSAVPASAAAEGAVQLGGSYAGACLRVERLVLARQQLAVLRQLEMAQDALPAERLAALKVQLITTSLAEVDFKKAVQSEQQAFESLAHTKATLTGTLLVDQTSLRQTEEALESGLQVARRRAGLRKGTAVHSLGRTFLYTMSAPAPPPPPCVIFDEREFRSSLPYDLYRRGMQLIPLTLSTADYVLSPEYAVERKSVQDYFQSVMSGRIQHQLAALSRRYAFPICLIEFHRGIPFRLMQYAIYAKTARLMAAYPRVGFVWARSPAHAAGMLVLLKKSVAADNVDPADPSLTGTSIDPGSAADVGGVAASAAERETAHYAARVLSRFPGVTHENAPRIMQLCGSLIGLATISLNSLAAAVGDEDAARLWGFLHAPFHEAVD